MEAGTWKSPEAWSAAILREDAARLRADYANCPVPQWGRKAMDEAARLEAKAERLMKEPA